MASPHKLRQDVSDMKNEYTRLAAECRTLSLQATDLQAQSAVVSQAATVGECFRLHAATGGGVASIGRGEGDAGEPQRAQQAAG